MKIRDIDFGKQPVFLAPMEDVTDPAFRILCKEFGAEMVYSEFVSADALIRMSPTQRSEFFARSLEQRWCIPNL